MTPASLADIARSTGFAISTVSRALRNSAEIPVSTQRIIKDAARRLNYRPNPLLASLARTRFATREADGIPLAYIHLPVGSEDEPLVRSIIKANQDYGRRLGYRIEPFLVSDFKDGVQATRVLYSRGFQGIILPALFRLDTLPGMDWNLFSVAGWGEIIADASHPFSSLVNHATVDHFRTVLYAWNEVKKRGYERIGFVLLNVSTIDDQLRWGAVQTCLREVSAKNRIPHFFIEWESGRYNTAELAAWIRRHRPEAIIGFNGLIRWALEFEGFRIPEDMPFASLNKDTNYDLLQMADNSDSGMKHMRLEAMFAAIDLLDQQIRHREFGLLPTSRIQVIQSHWIDGDSLPDRKDRR
jgi:LacI family transcriptional regulator